MDDRKLIYSLDRRLIRLEQQVDQLEAKCEALAEQLSRSSSANFPAAAAARISEGENAVKVIRQTRLMTQVELAEISGVGVNYISRIENGGGFGLQTAQRLAAALDVRVEDLS